MLRPILDFHALNRFYRKYKFQMLTHASLLRLVRSKGWFNSVNLKDEYLHIPIYPPPTDRTSGSLSRGAVTSIACTSSASLLAREYSCDAMYLKDWLLLAQSRQDVKAYTRILLQHLQNLGFFNKPGKEHAVSCSGGAVDYSLSEGGTFQGF